MRDQILTGVEMVDQLSGWSDVRIMKHHGTFDPNLSTDLFRGTSHFLAGFDLRYNFVSNAKIIRLDNGSIHSEKSH